MYYGTTTYYAVPNFPTANPNDMFILLASCFLPVVVGAVSGKSTKGAPMFVVVLLAGTYFNVYACIPVALLLSGLVLLSKPSKETPYYGLSNLFTPRVPASQLPQPEPVLIPARSTQAPPATAWPTGIPAPTAATAWPTSATSPTAVPTAPALSCPACAAPVALCGDRFPPWCPRCGSDLKAARPT